MANRLALSWSGLAVIAGACSRADHGPFRHVLLISLDTVRADHLDPYGDKGLTPRIARLAEEGLIFEHVLTPAPTTLAAHTSIMTGSYPSTHGVFRNGFRVNGENVMLAEILADAGFHTAAFLGSFALESTFDFDQGFDAFDERFDQIITTDNVGRDQNQRTADKVTDAVLQHVGEVDAERLFLFVHYFDAHQPYEPPADFARRLQRPGGIQSSTAKHMGEVIGEHTRAVLGRPKDAVTLISEGLSRKLIEQGNADPTALDRDLAALYGAEVSFVDSQIARLFDGLESEGVLDDALIVLTGDHGETFWEHGDFWNHGLWVYDSTTRVPLILRFPDARGAGTTVSAPVSTVDIVPTLCELLGLPVPERCEGVSLTPAVADTAFDRGPVFSQATQPFRVERWARVPWANLLKPRAVREGRWKYVQCPYLAGSPEDAFTKAPYEQLFDMQADPGERSNLLENELSAEAAQAYGKLRGELEGWARSVRPLLTEPLMGEQAREVDKILKSLGYTGAQETKPKKADRDERVDQEGDGE